MSERKRIREAAIAIIRTHSRSGIGLLDIDLTDQIAKEIGMVNVHPMQRRIKILNALEGDDRFIKSYMKVLDATGKREVKSRYFYLKEK